MQRTRWLIGAVVWVCLPAGLFAAEPDAKGAAFFEKNIRPVLVQHCYKCHSAESGKVKGGLLLDTRDGIRKGGKRDTRSSPAVPTKA